SRLLSASSLSCGASSDFFRIAIAITPSKLITRFGAVWIPRVGTPACVRVPAPAQLAADADPAAIPPQIPCRARARAVARCARLPTELAASGAERTSDRRQSQVRAG